MKEGLEVKLARFLQKIQLPLMMFMLQQSSNLEEILWILLPIASIMLEDDDLIEETAMYVEKFDEKVREKIEEFCEFWSRSENVDVFIMKTVML